MAIKISDFILNTNQEEFNSIITFLRLAKTDMAKRQVVAEITNNIKKSREIFNKYLQKNKKIGKILQPVRYLFELVDSILELAFYFM